MKNEVQIVDHSKLRFNQIGIVTFALLGYLLNEPLLPAFVAVVLLVGTVWPALALFKQTYAHVVKPLGWMRPDPVQDLPAAHEFAQLLGGIVLSAGTILFAAGWSLAGWTLTWIVILLAAANLFFGFCAGCFVYYQIGRLGVPGFRTRPEHGGGNGA